MKSPIQRFRLKEWQSFAAQNEEVYIETLVSDLKLYGFVSVFFFDKKREESVRFTKTLPLGSIWPLSGECPAGRAETASSLQGAQTVPAAIEGRTSGLFFSMTFHISENNGPASPPPATVRLLLDATFQHPALSAEFNCDFSRTEPIAVNAQSGGEKSASSAEKPAGPLSLYKNLCRTSGFITYGERVFSLSPESACGIFRDYKVFFPFAAKRAWSTGFGLDKTGRVLALSLVDICRVTAKSRENSLWNTAGLTPLPPVRITKTDDEGLEWTIQDVECMVDLNFAARKANRSQYDFFVTKADYESILGVFSGTLKDKNGLPVPIHSLWGTLETLYMRV